MKKINRDTAKKYIYATNGKFFSAVFRKKNGEMRNMTCRLKVKKYVKGVGRRFKPQNMGYVGVFDIHKDGHRLLNLATLKRLKIKGIKYQITDNEKENNSAR
tara:strand:+ start:320 stop:625 length:306 start_codon:yes stop_codon:yes gene_type:complete